MNRPTSNLRWRWWALGTVLVAEAMDIVDTTTVNVAGPAVRRSIGGSPGLVQWLSASYTLAFAALLITGARLGDSHGRRRMFLAGATGFTAASLLCGLSISPTMLIAARAVQGGFGAMLLPQGIGVITQLFNDRERMTAFGLYAPILSIASAIGPLLGGALIRWNVLGLGWRLIFLVNVVLGTAAIIGGKRFFPHDADNTAQGFDVQGNLIIAVATVMIVLPLIEGPASGWQWWSFALLGCGVSGLALFAHHERRATAPLIEPSLLQRSAFLSGVAVSLAFFSATSGIMLVLSLYTQNGLGYEPLRAGLALTPIALGNVIGSAIAVRTTASIGGRATILTNFGVAFLGLLVIAGTTGRPGDVTLIIPLLLIGVGFGGIIAPLFSTILTGIIPSEAGSASGSLGAIQQFAGSLGVAALATVYAATNHPADHGLRVTATTTIGILVLGAALALRLPGGRNSTSEASSDEPSDSSDSHRLM